jgi:hypothetical protein
VSLLKKIFPVSFLSKEADTNGLVTGIVLYAAMIVGYFLVGSVLGYLLGRVVAWLLGLFGTLVCLYATGGIVLTVLRYCGILK